MKPSEARICGYVKFSSFRKNWKKLWFSKFDWYFKIIHRLQEQRSEITSLHSIKQKLESQRYVLFHSELHCNAKVKTESLKPKKKNPKLLLWIECKFIVWCRSEILMKLQYMMQSQWNEAVQMLATTPQRKVSINRKYNRQVHE